MKHIFVNILIVWVVFLTSCNSGKMPEDKLVFENSIEDVTDSLLSFKGLANEISRETDVINCFIDGHDELIIDNVSIGRWDEIVSGGEVDQKVIKKVYSGDFRRLIALMSYLKKNHISGFYKDYSCHIFVFSYRDYEYGDRASDQRSILFKDDFNGNVKDDFIKKDESEQLILAVYNMPPP